MPPPITPDKKIIAKLDEILQIVKELAAKLERIEGNQYPS
jgi:hypothetical protein